MDQETLEELVWAITSTTPQNIPNNNQSKPKEEIFPVIIDSNDIALQPEILPFSLTSPFDIELELDTEPVHLYFVFFVIQLICISSILSLIRIPRETN